MDPLARSTSTVCIVEARIPWAKPDELVKYHREYLLDVERAVQDPLPHNIDAEGAYNRSVAAHNAQREQQKKEGKRTARVARTERREISAKRWTAAYIGLGAAALALAATIGGYALGVWDDEQPSPDGDTPPATAEQPVDE